MPVVIHDGKDFPTDLMHIQRFEIQRCFNVRMARNSSRAEELDAILAREAPALAHAIEAAPPWRQEWPALAAARIQRNAAASKAIAGPAADIHRLMGSIVTFYSYKGGVGRSMALANVAVLLAREGLKVLAVDWDLEAPGLDRYFESLDITPSGNGLLTMLHDADRGHVRPYGDYVWTVDVGSGKPLTLLPSGRENEPLEYATRLEDFDWRRFFANGGGDHLEDLRRQWQVDFDLVLIDSRTGLSDTEASAPSSCPMWS